MYEENPLTTPLDVLDDYFGTALGPDEVMRVRKMRDTELDGLLQRLEDHYDSPRGLPNRRHAELWAFPSSVNSRDVGVFCARIDPANVESAAEYGRYLRYLDLPQHVLKLLLYYHRVVVLDPVSIAALQAYPCRDRAYRPGEVRNALANAFEFLCAAGDFIRDGSVLLYPRFAIAAHVGKTADADAFECSDPEYAALSAKYGFRAKHARPILFPGGFDEWRLISQALARDNVPESELRLCAALVNGYMSFARWLDCDYLAESQWVWDILRYKMRFGSKTLTASMAAPVQVLLQAIDLTDFEAIGTEELGMVRRNDEAFAAWRSDIASLCAPIASADLTYEQAWLLLQRMASDILPRRAAEVRRAVCRSSLKRHVSDGGLSFAASGMAGIATAGSWEGLVSAGAGAASGLLLSLLFRRGRKDEQVLLALYTALTSRDERNGAFPIV